jgi:peroxiredoxin
VTARGQWAVVGAVVLLLAGGLLAATRLVGGELAPVTVGARAPDFRARTLDPVPRARTIADYRGQVVLLNLWATWCPPCRAEMPSMQALHDSLGGKGLRVVAVSVDDAGNEEAIRAFAKAYGLTFEILHDPSGDIQRAYQTSGLPESFVIDREGVIRKTVIAATNWDTDANRTLVRALLEESR